MIIGLIGPAIQGLGLIWVALHLALGHWSTPLTARHLIYEPSSLLVVVGFLASLVCIPVALELAQASEEDVEIPVYEPQLPAAVEDLTDEAELARRRLAGRRRLPRDRGQLPRLRG